MAVMSRRSPELEQYGEPAMTPAEAEALAAIFADELARGWIPKPSDLEDALAALRAQ